MTMEVKLVSGFFTCPECGGGHTCHEHNALGHAVGCSLKPEEIIGELLVGLKEISEMEPEVLAADGGELAARLILECPAVKNR